MEILKYGAIVLLSLSALIIVIFCIRSGKPLKNLFLNAALGIAVVAAIDLTARFSGVHIPINGWTAAGVAIYGLPAVCGFLLLPLIFK